MKKFLLYGATALLLGCGLPSVAQSPAVLRMQAFAQDQANNCISVALIKAAILRYGVGEVFDTLRTGTQVQVTLRDGTLLVLTDAERQQAAAWARFKQPLAPGLPTAERAAIVSYATFCYAVLAKYIQTKHLHGCTNDAGQAAVLAPLGRYRRTLRFLTNTSICSDNAYRHLGLPVLNDKAPPYSPSQVFSPTTGAVAYNDGHAVFVLGNQYDDHGKWQPLAQQVNADAGSFEPKWYFELK